MSGHWHFYLTRAGTWNDRHSNSGRLSRSRIDAARSLLSPIRKSNTGYRGETASPSSSTPRRCHYLTVYLWTRVRAQRCERILQVLLPSGRNADKKQSAPGIHHGYLYGSACNADEEFLTFMDGPIRADNFSAPQEKARAAEIYRVHCACLLTSAHEPTHTPIHTPIHTHTHTTRALSCTCTGQIINYFIVEIVSSFCRRYFLD